MDVGVVITFIYESAFFLAILGLTVTYSTVRGRQAMINVIIGLYIAILLFTMFPYDSTLWGTQQGSALAFTQIAFFSFLTILATILCHRVMPDEFNEKTLESLGKKFLLALVATALIVAVSFQILSVTELIATDTPLQTLFAEPTIFFWWLLGALGVLYFVS